MIFSYYLITCNGIEKKRKRLVVYFTFWVGLGKITLAASSRPCPWASGRCRRNCLGLCCGGLAGRRRGSCAAC